MNRNTKYNRLIVKRAHYLEEKNGSLLRAHYPKDSLFERKKNRIKLLQRGSLPQSNKKIHHNNSTPSTTFGSPPPTNLGTLKM